MKLDDKIEVPALKPLWKNFERFALYSDFRDLYDKTLPEIVKFEQRIINITKDMEDSKSIITSFDKLIA